MSCNPLLIPYVSWVAHSAPLLLKMTGPDLIVQTQRNARQIARILVRNLTVQYSQVSAVEASQQPSGIAGNHLEQGSILRDALSQGKERRASDPSGFSKAERTPVRSKSRSSLRSTDTSRSVKTPKRSGSLHLDEGKASSPTLELSLETSNAQTTRQRSSTLGSVLSHASDMTPSLSRRYVSSRSIHRHHHVNEAQANEDRWKREAEITRSMVYARCDLSFPSATVASSSSVTLDTEMAPVSISLPAKGPACNFDWDVDLSSPSMTMTVAIWVVLPQDQHKLYSDLVLSNPKGKERARDDWMHAITWTLDLNGLKHVGRSLADVKHFAANTVIVEFNDGEYFTLPSSSLAPEELNTRQNALLDLADEEDEDAITASNVSLPLQQQPSYPVHRNRNDIVERSLRETRMLNSENFDNLVTFVQLESAITTEQAALEQSIQVTNSLVDNPSRQLKRSSSFKAHEISWLKRETNLVRQSCEQRQVELLEKRNDLTRRRGRLKEAQANLSARIHSTQLEEHVALQQDRSSTLRLDLSRRRAAILAILDFIFPIGPINEGPSGLAFGICDHYLPNSEFPASMSYAAEEQYSSALGLAAQLVNMLAAYLGIALYYPITPAGSRSLISDFISTMKGPNTFPLYPTGVEQYRFEYAVFLLNKNIEQLLQSQDVIVMDLRHTLPNLKNLMLTVSARDQQGSTETTSLPRRHRSDSVRSNSPAPTLKASSPLGDALGDEKFRNRRHTHDKIESIKQLALKDGQIQSNAVSTTMPIVSI